jgi:hypothetical protein
LLAARAKIKDKIELRALAGPESGIACPGIAAKMPGGSLNERPVAGSAGDKLFLLLL